jgi:hypothetical protein
MWAGHVDSHRQFEGSAEGQSLLPVVQEAHHERTIPPLTLSLSNGRASSANPWPGLAG